MQKLKIIDYDYIFVTGTIGAGKTSLIDKLASLYQDQAYIIKEYIDYDEDGNNKLNDFLDGKYPAYDFQKYIVDCYMKQFIEADKFFFDKKGQKIIICERHPLESLLFASFKLDQHQMGYLHDYIKDCCEKLRIPLPTECYQIIFRGEATGSAVNTDESLTKVANKIKVRKCDNKNLFVHLDVDDKQQLSRLMKRGRESDLKYLNEPRMEYLNRINIHYKNLAIANYDIKLGNLYIFYKYDIDEEYEYVEETPVKVKAKPFKK